MVDKVPDVRDELQAAGLRVTAQRAAVLSVLRDEGHLQAGQVIDRVVARLAAVSDQAVYNALDTLGRAGLVRRIQPARSPALFEARVGDNHHHAVCRSCGAVVDLDCAIGERPCLTPSDAGGYVLDEAEIMFWGLCPACQRPEATGSEPS